MREVPTMGITLTQTSTRFVLPVRGSANDCVHHTLVGLSAVQDLWMPVGTAGGSKYLEPRNTHLTVRTQPINGAFTGISGSAAQGSQKPEALTGAKANGVPPRSRPV
jgi:hypothetical protein